MNAADYRAAYERSLRDPEGYWREVGGIVEIELHQEIVLTRS